MTNVYRRCLLEGAAYRHPGGLLVAEDGYVTAVCRCCGPGMAEACRCLCHNLPLWPDEIPVHA